MDLNVHGILSNHILTCKDISILIEAISGQINVVFEM